MQVCRASHVLLTSYRADDSLRAASHLWGTLENTADAPPEKSPFQVAYGVHRFEFAAHHVRNPNRPCFTTANCDVQPAGKTLLDVCAIHSFFGACTDRCFFQRFSLGMIGFALVSGKKLTLTCKPLAPAVFHVIDFIYQHILGPTCQRGPSSSISEGAQATYRSTYFRHSRRSSVSSRTWKSSVPSGAR